MTGPLTEKDKLLAKLTDIYNQLEELESVLETSFSNHRTSLNQEEQEKVNGPVKKLHIMEEMMEGKFGSIHSGQAVKSLKLELGFGRG